MIYNDNFLLFLALFLFSKYRLPFDTTKVLGFYAGWLGQCLSSIVFLLIFSAITSLYIGFCRYIRACIDDFENDISKLSQLSIVLLKPGHQLKSHPRIRSELIEAIKFHWEIFEIMENVQRVMSGPFFKVLCTYAIFIGHSLHSQVISFSIIFLESL